MAIIKKLKNTFNNWTEHKRKINEIIDNGSGGGSGFTPTETQLEAMNSGITSARVSQIGVNKNNITLLSQNKLDKLTDEGEFIYSHEGEIQNSKGFEVADDPSGSTAHVASSKTVKAVKTALTTEIDKKVDKINITAQSTQGLYPITINAQGQVASYGTKQTPSDTYTSTGNDQLLTRKGAYNMYNDITQVKDKGWTTIISGVQYCCKNRVVSIKISGNVTADANGIIANVPSGYRPTQETPFSYGVDFGAVMDKGGWVATNGEIRVHVYSTSLSQVRMFLTYTI